MKKLRIGMVGFGFISDWHLRGFKDNPDADITGICHIFFGSEQQRTVEMESLKKNAQNWVSKLTTVLNLLLKILKSMP